MSQNGYFPAVNCGIEDWGEYSAGPDFSKPSLVGRKEHSRTFSSTDTLTRKETRRVLPNFLLTMDNNKLKGWHEGSPPQHIPSAAAGPDVGEAYMRSVYPECPFLSQVHE